MRTQKSATSNHLQSVPPPPLQVDDVAVSSVDALAAEARRLAPDVRQPITGDLTTLHTNAERGVAAVVAERARLDDAKVPARWSQITALPAIALAYCDVVSRIAALEAQESGNAALWSSYWTTREKLLAAAEGLAAWNKLPSAPVTALRSAKKGSLRAHDVHRLTDLFREHAASVQGFSPVSAANLADADALADKVLKQRGTGATAVDAALDEARRTRDALAWMLRDRHDHLRALAAWLWPRDASKHVPALTTRTRTTPRAVATPAPAPTPAPVTG